MGKYVSVYVCLRACVLQLCHSDMELCAVGQGLPIELAQRRQCLQAIQKRMLNRQVSIEEVSHSSWS